MNIKRPKPRSKPWVRLSAVFAALALTWMHPGPATADELCVEVAGALDRFDHLIELYEEVHAALEATVVEALAQLQSPDLEPSGRVALTRFIRDRNETRRELRELMRDVETLREGFQAYYDLEGCP